jgi:hypothetical protein
VPSYDGIGPHDYGDEAPRSAPPCEGCAMCGAELERDFWITPVRRHVTFSLEAALMRPELEQRPERLLTCKAPECIESARLFQAEHRRSPGEKAARARATFHMRQLSPPRCWKGYRPR